VASFGNKEQTSRQIHKKSTKKLKIFTIEYWVLQPLSLSKIGPERQWGAYSSVPIPHMDFRGCFAAEKRKRNRRWRAEPSQCVRQIDASKLDNKIIQINNSHV